MRITIGMLLTHFADLYPEMEPVFPEDPRNLEGVRLLPPVSYTGELSENAVYITDHPDRHLAGKAYSHLLIVCFVQRKNSLSAVSNVTIIETSEDLSVMFNLLQQAFQDFVNWEKRLDFAIQQGDDLQLLLHISQNIIPVPVMIYDPSMKLLAFSENAANFKDGILQRVVELGYISRKDAAYFTETNAFRDTLKNGIYEGQPDNYREHPDVIRIIYLNGEPVLHCAMLQAGTWPASYLKEVFHIFCDALQKKMNMQGKGFQAARSVADFFLASLLDNPDTPEENIRERIQYNDLELEGNYMVVSIHTDAQENYRTQYTIQLMRSNMYNCRIFPYYDKIVILYVMPKYWKQDYRDSLKRQFQGILSESMLKHMLFFFSRPFHTLLLFSAAYAQAENIFQMKKNGDWKDQFFFYDDWWEQDLFFTNRSKDLVFSFCDPAVYQMMKDQSARAKTQLQILYTYLNCDRSMTAAARLLHMHRNNVVYHIKKIEEACHLDLDDPKVRRHLLLSFELLKYRKLLPEEDPTFSGKITT